MTGQSTTRAPGALRQDPDTATADRLDLLCAALETRLETRLRKALAGLSSGPRAGARILPDPLSLLAIVGEQESFMLHEKEGRLRREGQGSAADLACLARVTVLPRAIERLRARRAARAPGPGKNRA